VGVLINYIDRVNLSAAGPQLTQEFGLSPVQFGYLAAAFSWSYALLQIPTGVILDKFGVTLVGRIGAFLWGVASALVMIVSGYYGIILARILLGVAEAPAFPASSKATGYWFPRRERARATAIFDAAAKFSNVIGLPLVAYFVVNWGWRWGFGITALLSFAYFIAFVVFYRDPSRDPKLSDAERTYIKEGGATAEGTSSAGTWAMLGNQLQNTKVWGLTIGFAAYGYSFALFINWLPSYLAQTFQFNLMKSAGYAAIAWGCATLADLIVGGWLVDHLIARGHDESKVRKTVLVLGMLFGLAVFGAAFTTDPNWAIFWIAIALSGLASAAPIGWSIPSLIAPKGGTATIGGIMNCLNNLMGIAAPIATGYIVAATRSFSAAFLVAAAVLVIGIFSYIFVLGRIEPIPEPGAKGLRPGMAA
jgi:MFS family permease